MARQLSAEADGQPTPRQLVDICSSVGSEWATLAQRLSPELFGPQTGRIEVIQDEHPRKQFMQAQAMIGQWINHYANKATRRDLIKAMYAVSLQANAVAAFDEELVDFVMNSPKATEGAVTGQLEYENKGLF